MHRYLLGIALFLSWSFPTAAQFAFFDHLFGNQQQQQQQQQRQQRGSGGGNAQWNVYADSVSCSNYLCPDSLACVVYPSECPCPYPEDIKCVLPDIQDGGAAGTIVCVRGEKGCAAMEHIAMIQSQ